MSRPIRVLELRSVRGTGGGPDKTIVLGAARENDGRMAVTVCYIRDARDQVFGIDERARQQGIDYVEVSERHSFDPSIWRSLRQLVRDRHIDIVHAHDYKTDLLAWALAKVEHVIPLATAHGWTGHSGRERWFYYPLDKRLLGTFPRVIAVSTEIRDTLIRAGAPSERVVTVLNGIDHRRFRRQPDRGAAVRRQLGLDPAAVVIGSAGRLEPQKRYDILLEAFARLRPAHPELQLVIAGDGSLRQELSARAARLGLGSACRFLGQTDHVVELHDALDLFVQSSDYEGTPNAVLEAMALETPIVATNAGGTTDLVTNGVHAVVVPPRDVDALVRGIEEGLQNPAAARQRTAAARVRVEQVLSFDARMDALTLLCEDLVTRIGRHAGVRSVIAAT